MTSPPRVRLVAASLVLGVTTALLAAVSGPASSAEPDVTSGAVSRGHDDVQRKKKGKVVWDSTSFYATAAPVAAHGRVPGGKKRVKLQVKLPGGWHTFAKTKSSRKGKFSIAGQLDWYGAHKVRVATTGKRAFKRSTTVSVFANYAARGNPADHAFTTGEHGLRYSFDPCETVRYVVNADDVGPAGIAMAQVAMAQLSAATGIKVKYAGTSHQIPFQTKETRLPRRQDFLIAWADEAELPDFATQGKIGFGGPFRIKRARDGRGRPVLMSTQGAAVLNTNAYLSGVYTQGWTGTKPTWGEVVLHELGHGFGLAHVGAADEIMYPASGAGVYPDGNFRGLYSAGDLAGLATNGLGQGCFRQVRSFREGVAARVAAPEPLP